MPFWSRGGSEEAKPQESNFTSDDVSGFSTSDNNFAAASSDDAMMSQATGLGDMQQFTVALRQQMLVQTVINTLTDKAFEKCITKPGDSLSGREVACVNATVCKWLDTNQFMNGRMEKKMGNGGGMM